MSLMDDMIKKGMLDMQREIDPKFKEMMDELRAIKNDQGEILRILKNRD